MIRSGLVRRGSPGRPAALGVDVNALAARLQEEVAEAFVRSWDELIENIGEKSSVLAAATAS